MLKKQHSNIYKQLAPLARKLKVEFKNKDLLVNAMTHRSYLNENPGFPLPHNERLEFLGDAVLELIISKFLFNKYPGRPEGELTSFRSAIVKTPSLANISRELELGKYILLSTGEESTGGRDRDHILANTFEAVLGAIYLDRGFKTSEEFVTRVLVPEIDTIVEHRLDIDNKSKFQEIVQELLKVTPEYKLIDEHGPDHDKSFTMAVFVNGKQMGKGEGKSKQEAEQNAATEALKVLEKNKIARTA